MSTTLSHRIGIRRARTESAPPAFKPETGDAPMMRFATIEDMVKTLRPDQSIQCLFPEAMKNAARTFVEQFPGLSHYAVKANPDPYILQCLYDAGIRHFDVASPNEIALVRGMFPDAHLAFMHPVKSRQAIRDAYFEYGVRAFVIDTFEELHKILEELKMAADLTIVVRLERPRGSAACPLTHKFGASPEVAVSLLRDVARVAHKVGLSFHVGSQSLDPMSYVEAVRKAGEVVRESGVTLSVFNVGGGFPIPGLGMDVPPLTDYFNAIRKEVAALKLPKKCQVWCEPGRALCGTGTILLVRVELRKGNILYINDGSFGNMFEVTSMNWKNTCALIRPLSRGRKAASKTLVPFEFYGPTCDSVDFMPGPFLLPEDVCEGDWIAMQGMGAYMACSSSKFNGFYSDVRVEIAGESASSRRRMPRRASHLRLVNTERPENKQNDLFFSRQGDK